MRRDWFVTGAIVVVATAFGLLYLMSPEGCDPVSGLCTQRATWEIPILLLVLAVGAGVMLFSVNSSGPSKSGKTPEAKKGSEEEPLRNLTETLSELEAVIQTTEKKILSDHEVVQARMLTAREAPTVEARGIVASGAVTEKRPHVQEAGQSLSEQEAGKSSQAEDVMTPNERLVSIERWTLEAIRLSEEVLGKENDLIESRKRLLDLEEQLRSESDVLTTDWDSFVERDRSLLLEVRRLIGTLGVGRFPLVDNAVRPPSSLPSVRKALSDALGAEAPPVDQVRVTKNEAVERMKKAVQSARKAPDTRDSSVVQDMLNLALVSFKVGEFEDAVRHSEEVLEILRGSPSGS